MTDEIRKKRQGNSRTVLCLVLVIANLLALNVLSSRHFVRIDLTESKAYTLSLDTIRVLESIDDMIRIKYYITHDLPPGFGSYRDRTEDMLEEFGVVARGRLKVQVLDPSKDPDARIEAENYGIAEVPLEQRATESYEARLAFMGITVLYEDRHASIPFVNPDVLEYELLMRIARVLEPEPPTVAFFEAAQQMPGLMPEELRALEADNPEPERHSIHTDYRVIADYLGKQYRVTTVSLSEPVPDSVDTLVVANEANLDETALYHMDQFLMRGGKLALLIAGCEVDLVQYRARSTESVIDPWLAHQGIELKRNMVMDPSCARVRFDSHGRFLVRPFPPCLRIDEGRIDQEHAITRDIKNLVMPFCGALAFPSPDAAVAHVLAESTDESWVMEDAFSIEPNRIRRPENPVMGPFGLMGILEGEFISYYSVMPAPESVSVRSVPRLHSPQTAIFVAGSSDFIGNPIRMQEQDVYRQTLLMFGNAVDYLTTGEGFWKIRAREQNVRYIDLKYREDPEAALGFKVAGTLSGALLVVVLGGIVYLWRRAGRYKNIQF